MLKGIVLWISTLAPWLSPATVERYAYDIYVNSNGDINLAAALTTTANYESNFRHDVEICKRRGDKGRAISLYQLHKHLWKAYSKRSVCQSNRLATRIAAGNLSAIARSSGTWETALARFVGFEDTSNPRIKERIDTFNTLRGMYGEQISRAP